MRRTLLTIPLLVLFAAPASAHKTSLIAVDLTAKGREVALALRSTTHDLLPFLGTASDESPPAAQLEARRTAVLRGVASYLTVLADGRAVCPLRQSALRVEPDRAVVLLSLGYRCPRSPELLEVRYDLFLELGPGHRAVVTTHEPDTRVHFVSPDERTVRVARQVSLLSSAIDFGALGIEHIFTGYDHLMFLLALLLMAGAIERPAAGEGRTRIRPGLLYLFTIVTSFTVAHSATLILAATGRVSLPSRVVEPAIALTIVYVGVENLFIRDPRRRWLLTFFFGLVHGFGFAQILREVGLPREGLLLSLLSFNLGVEVGQVAVVALVFPAVFSLARGRVGLAGSGLIALVLGALFVLLSMAEVRLSWQVPVTFGLALACVLLVRRHGYRRVVLQAGSALIALLGLLWLAERTSGVVLLGGHLG